MSTTTRTVAAVAAATVVTLGGFGVAAASNATPATQERPDDDGPNEARDSDAPLTGSDLDRAVDAALEHTGGGTVIESEAGDDGAAFGVEIRRPDGRQVEVNLDADFKVIGADADAD
jgi:uncharacterized membrane protein YkoI